jgi:HJR/Mrr/RecB family endonuclease
MRYVFVFFIVLGGLPFITGQNVLGHDILILIGSLGLINHIGNIYKAKWAVSLHGKQHPVISLTNSYNYNSPLDFEKWCADTLIERGWAAKLTRGSGDQGIDIIAEKDGRTLVVQCKKWQNACGNKAVQEIIAGREYIGADMAMVVATGGFTTSAKQLAHKTEVILLSQHDLRVYVLGE